MYKFFSYGEDKNSGRKDRWGGEMWIGLFTVRVEWGLGRVCGALAPPTPLARAHSSTPQDFPPHPPDPPVFLMGSYVFVQRFLLFAAAVVVFFFCRWSSRYSCFISLAPQISSHTYNATALLIQYTIINFLSLLF